MYLKVETKYQYPFIYTLGMWPKNKKQKRKKSVTYKKFSSIRGPIWKMSEFTIVYYLPLMFPNSYFRQEAQGFQMLLFYISWTSFTSYTSNPSIENIAHDILLPGF